jgi:hypothetical protein
VRAAARRLEAFQTQTYYVSYPGDPRLAAFGPAGKVLVQRKLVATVHTFSEEKRDHAPDNEGFDVERAGEIVALAIARQLKAMRWEVDLVVTRAMLPGGAMEAQAFRDRARGEPIGRVVVNGEVHRFRVIEERRSQITTSAAHLEATVRFLDHEDREIYRRRLSASRAVAEQQVAERTERPRQAARGVLQELVRQLLGDPNLGRALLKVVDARRKL